MPTIYLASSHRNEFMPDVYTALRAEGFDVYSPHVSGFTWPNIGLNPTPDKKQILYRESKVMNAFQHNLSMLQNCNAVIGVEPFGLDAALMLGYACSDKPDETYLLLSRGKPVLASLMFQHVYDSIPKLIQALKLEI